MKDCPPAPAAAAAQSQTLMAAQRWSMGQPLSPDARKALGSPPEESDVLQLMGRRRSAIDSMLGGAGHALAEYSASASMTLDLDRVVFQVRQVPKRRSTGAGNVEDGLPCFETEATVEDVEARELPPVRAIRFTCTKRAVGPSYESPVGLTVAPSTISTTVRCGARVLCTTP